MKTKNSTIDALRILMAVLVIMIHSTLVIHDKNIIEFMMVEGFGRVAVPFFFVVSGFYLEQTINKNKLSSWLSRILKMYIAWNIIYFPFQVHIVDAIIDKNIYDINFNSIPFDLLFGYWQLWFLPAVIMGALLINAFSKTSTPKLLTMSILIFIGSCTLWYLSLNKIITMNGFWGNALSIRNGVFFGFPLMTFGFILARKQESEIVEKFLSSGYMLLFSAILVALEAVFGFFTAKAFYDLTFSSGLMAICLVCYALRKPDAIILNIDGASVSTYLYMTHVAFFLVYSRFTQNPLLLFTSILLSSIISTIMIMMFRKRNLKTS